MPTRCLRAEANAPGSRRGVEARFYPELESLRGLAALCVLAGHCFIMARLFMWYSARSVPAFLLSEFFAGVRDPQPPVLLFFVLSGFVLRVQLVSSPVCGLKSYLAFLLRRAFRLLPVLWVTSVLAYAIRPMVGPTDFPFDLGPISVHTLLRCMFLVDPKLNWPTWSLLVEAACGAVVPLMVYVANRKNVVLTLLVFAVLLYGRYQGLPQCLAYLIFFFSGVLVGTYQNVALKYMNQRLVSILAVVGFICYAWAPELVLGGRPRLDWSQWDALEIPACCLLMLVAIDGRCGWLALLLNSWLARSLGRLSYSIYLLHFPFVMLAASILYRSELNQLGIFAFILTFTLAFTLPLAIMIRRYVEIPTIALGRRLARLLTIPQDRTNELWRSTDTPEQRPRSLTFGS